MTEQARTPIVSPSAARADQDVDEIADALRWRRAFDANYSSTHDRPDAPEGLREWLGRVASRREAAALVFGTGDFDIAAQFVEWPDVVEVVDLVSRPSAEPPLTVHSELTADPFDTASIERRYALIAPIRFAGHCPTYLLPTMIASWRCWLADEGLMIIAAPESVRYRGVWSEHDLSGIAVPEHRMYSCFVRPDELDEMLVSAGMSVLDSFRHSEFLAGWGETEFRYMLAAQAEKLPSSTAWPSVEILRTQGRRDAADQLELKVAVSARSSCELARERVNRSVALDILAAFVADRPEYLRQTSERLRQTLFVPRRGEAEFDDYWTIGGLFHKIGDYAHALECLTAARELRPYDYRPVLRAGYCYEGLRDFDAAVEAGLDAFALAASELGEESSELTEVRHALGHFYAGASHVERTVHDDDAFRTGLYFMLDACQSVEGVAYVSCIGSMFSERDQHGVALDWYDWADARLPDTDSEDDRRREVDFYRAVSLTGAGRYREALEVYADLSAWARRVDDSDALSHAVLFGAKAQFGSSPVTLGTVRLRRLVAEIEQAQPSRYVVGGVRNERRGFLRFLNGCSHLDEAASGDSGATSRLDLARVCFEQAAELGRISPGPVTLTPLGCPADICTPIQSGLHDHGVKSLVSDSPPVHAADFSAVVAVVAVEDLAGAVDVLETIGRYRRDSSYLVTWDTTGILCDALHSPAESFVVRYADEAVALVSCMALYAACYDRYVSFETPLGLAPIVGAPSRLAVQAGELDFVT